MIRYQFLYAAVFLLVTNPAFANTADSSNKYCEYKESQFVPALKKAVTSYLTEHLKFSWSEDSLDVSCEQYPDSDSENVAGCDVSFRAQDGVNFILHENPGCYLDSYHELHCGSSERMLQGFALKKSQPADEEGGNVGPATCTAIIDYPWVINSDTGNRIDTGSKNQSIFIKYQQ